jgi:hypothetical protein
LQPVDVIRPRFFFLNEIVVESSLSAENVIGAGCCRKPGISIFILRPLILPCRTALTAPPFCSR